MRYEVDFRDGRASEGLQRLQAIQTEMLGQFLAFCEREGLRPFLVAGSAIGAVRHSGFIPWDDDIDVGLMRDDFERFKILAREQPLPGLFVQTPETDPGYPLAFAKLCKPGTAVGVSSFEGVDVQGGIFLDVFPFDLLPASAVRRRLQYVLLAALNIVITSFSWNLASATGSSATRAIRRLAFLARPVLPWRRAITFRDRVANPPGAKRSDRAICFEMYGLRGSRRTVIPVADLEPPSLQRFENLNAPLPRDVNKYLTLLFGNYRQLPPAENRKPQHITWVEC